MKDHVPLDEPRWEDLPFGENSLLGPLLIFHFPVVASLCARFLMFNPAP